MGQGSGKKGCGYDDEHFTVSHSGLLPTIVAPEYHGVCEPCYAGFYGRGLALQERTALKMPWLKVSRVWPVPSAFMI